MKEKETLLTSFFKWTALSSLPRHSSYSVVHDCGCSTALLQHRVRRIKSWELMIKNMARHDQERHIHIHYEVLSVIRHPSRCDPRFDDVAGWDAYFSEASWQHLPRKSMTKLWSWWAVEKSETCAAMIRSMRCLCTERDQTGEGGESSCFPKVWQCSSGWNNLHQTMFCRHPEM